MGRCAWMETAGYPHDGAAIDLRVYARDARHLPREWKTDIEAKRQSASKVHYEETRPGAISPSKRSQAFRGAYLVSSIVYGLVNVRTDGETIMCATMNDAKKGWKHPGLPVAILREASRGLRSHTRGGPMARAKKTKRPDVEFLKPLVARANKVPRLRDGVIRLRFTDGEPAVIGCRRGKAELAPEPGEPEEEPLIEVMGDRDRIRAIVEGKKDARKQFLAGGLRIRGDLGYFSDIAVELGAVYEALGRPPNNWDRAKTYYNIIRKISPDDVQGSTWDSDSVMHYPFRAGLIRQPVQYAAGVFPAPGLSDRDRAWGRVFYPPTDETAIKELRVGQAETLPRQSGAQADFQIVPTATRRYRIATFGEADTLLVLFEEHDGELRYRAADDDSGTDRNAHIRVRLRKGRRYVLRARIKYAGGPFPPVVLMW